MATKFYNSQARLFNQLLDGGNFEEIFAREEAKINSLEYSCSDEIAQGYKDKDIQDLKDVKTFFDKIQFLEEAEIYAVDAWGYGQTNYENLKVIGQVGGSMVCIIDSGHSDVYTIQKKKYVDKTQYTYLNADRVRSTSWGKPYSREALIENSYQNAYYGY